MTYKTKNNGKEPFNPYSKKYWKFPSISHPPYDDVKCKRAFYQKISFLWEQEITLHYY